MDSSVHVKHLQFQGQQCPTSNADEPIRGFGRTDDDLQQSVFAAPRAWRSGSRGVDFGQGSDLTRELAHVHGVGLERDIALAADVVETTRRAARVNDVR